MSGLWDVIRDFFQALFSFDQAHPLLFTQFYFWAFFALVFAVFSLFHSKVLLRNGYLFACSLFFYYKTSGVFLALLLFVGLYYENRDIPDMTTYKAMRMAFDALLYPYRDPEKMF